MAISSRSVEKPLVTKLVYDDYRPKKSKMTQKLLFCVLMICRDADLRSFESYLSLIRKSANHFRDFHENRSHSIQEPTNVVNILSVRFKLKTSNFKRKSTA